MEKFSRRDEDGFRVMTFMRLYIIAASVRAVQCPGGAPHAGGPAQVETAQDAARADTIQHSVARHSARHSGRHSGGGSE